MTTIEEITSTALAPARPAAAIGFGLSAANWHEGFQIAQILAESQLVPKHYQGRPEDVIVAMQMGAEIGLPPMAALQSIAVIGGRPGLYGDGFLGVVMASPQYAKHVEFYVTGSGEIVNSLTPSALSDDESRAVSKFWRRGITEPFVGEFSIADAKRAGLLNKDVWRQYLARMLRWRAREFAARDGFAAELRGIVLADDLDDRTNGTPPPVEAPIVAPVRRSEKAARPATVRVEEPPPPEPPEPPDPREPPPPPDPPPQPEPQPPEFMTSEFPAASTSRKRPRPDPPPPDAATLHGPPMSKPSTARPTAAPTGGVLDGLIILDTAYVASKSEEPFYEIRARVAKEGAAPIAYIFLTRDKALYDLAASAEGTPQTFAMRWRPGKRPDGTQCKILDTIAAS